MFAAVCLRETELSAERLHTRMNRNDEPALLTVPEFSRRAGISRWKTYDLVKKKMLPAVSVGETIMIPAMTVEGLVAKALENVTKTED